MSVPSSGPVSSKISETFRSTDEINKQIADLSAYYSKRHNIIKKILIRENKKRDIATWFLISVLFYVLALISNFIGNSSAGIDLFFNFATANSLDFVLMPFYLFGVLFTVSAITLAIKKSILTLPKVMVIPTESYQKAIKRFEGNIAPLIIALPFVLFDLVYLLQQIQSGTYTNMDLLPILVLHISWIIEFILFGNILWLLLYYIIYIHHITKKYSYDPELLNVLLRDELRPIAHVGYEQSIVLAVLLLLNIFYAFITANSTTYFVESLLIFIFIILTAFIPLNEIHADLKKEIEKFSSDKVNYLIDISKNYFINREMSVDQKIDYVLTDRILNRLQTAHEKHSSKAIYLRIVGTLIVPLIGYYAKYGQKLTLQLNQTLHTTFPYYQLVHLILTYLPFLKI